MVSIQSPSHGWFTFTLFDCLTDEKKKIENFLITNCMNAYQLFFLNYF